MMTPCLIVDEARMMRNIERLAAHAASLGVPLRPHLKTGKSVEVARRMLPGGTGPAMVSTLAEAEVFAAAGIRDITYGVGIALNKLNRVLDLHRAGCRLTVLVELRSAGAGRCRRLGAGGHCHSGADRDRQRRSSQRVGAG